MGLDEYIRLEEGSCNLALGLDNWASYSTSSEVVLRVTLIADYLIDLCLLKGDSSSSSMDTMILVCSDYCSLINFCFKY